MPPTCPRCEFPLDPGAPCARCQDAATPLAEAAALSTRTLATPAPWTVAEPAADAVAVTSSTRDAKTYRSGIAFDRPRTLTRTVAPSVTTLASRLARAGAFAIDAACVSALAGVCFAAGAIAFGLGDLRAAGAGHAPTGAARILASNPASFAACLLLVFAIASGYAVWFVGAAGRTPGMARFGLRAVAADGSALGFGGAISRWGAVLVATLPLGLGLAWAAVDPDGRGLHDRLAGTRVVSR